MVNEKRSLWVGALGAILLSANFAAEAQEGGGNAIIGPPQLKDFRLPQENRLGREPAPPPPVTTVPARPVDLAPPPPPAASRTQPPQRSAAPPPGRPTPQATARPAVPRADAPAPAPEDTVPRDPAASTAPAAPVGTEIAPAPPTTTEEAVPAAPGPESAPAPQPAAGEGQGTSYWYYALPVAALVLLGLALAYRRRRSSGDLAPVEDAPAAAPPPKPRPDPMPRPWLELSLKAERASFTANEALVYFELEIANKGKAPARNLRLDVKMFNAGSEQDREIGAFFKTAGRETTKLKLPVVEAGVTGVIQGSVRMPREEMRAMRLDERLLFIPVVAVNALYDWGEGRTGQTSRSYLIGRELQESSEKMGAFRVDQGPRIWRTIGQRPHTLTKRV